MNARSFSAAILFASTVVPAFAGTVLTDDFNNLSQWKDLSTAVTWGGNTGAVSAFETTGGAVSLTTTAMANGGYTTASSLKTFTALDHQFATPINRAGNQVEVVMRMRWNSLLSNGESNRFILTLTHAYPTGGLDLDLNDRYDDFTNAPNGNPWWARPAYQVRMRGGTTSSTSGSTILQYGGGLSDAGEFEKLNTSWWLPGFNSTLGGQSPGTGQPGNVVTSSSIASDTFKTYRYLVHPDYQQIWVDDNNNGLWEAGELKAQQSLIDPLDTFNGVSFDNPLTLDGLRLYWRAASTSPAGTNPDVFIDSISVMTSVIPEPTTLGLIALGFLGLRRRR